MDGEFQGIGRILATLSCAAFVSGCISQNAYDTEISVFGLPPRAVAMFVLAETNEGVTPIAGVHRERIDEPGVEEHRINTPPSRRNLADTESGLRRRLRVRWVEAPRYHVLLLDRHRRWQVWTFRDIYLDLDPGGGAEGMNRIYFDLNMVTPQPAPSRLFEIWTPKIGLPEPRFTHEPDGPEDARGRRVSVRLLLRSLAAAEALIGEDRLPDAVAEVAEFLNYRDARAGIPWSPDGEAALRAIYRGFEGLRGSAALGNAGACREQLLFLRCAAEPLNAFR
ncbi:MAG: hypothetical protein HYY18_10720 [Planctomycetes bacterium]|nr:hypothetical protein [Planctomycetota bacterium]